MKLEKARDRQAFPTRSTTRSTIGATTRRHRPIEASESVRQRRRETVVPRRGLLDQTTRSEPTVGEEFQEPCIDGRPGAFHHVKRQGVTDRAIGTGEAGPLVTPGGQHVIGVPARAKYRANRASRRPDRSLCEGCS